MNIYVCGVIVVIAWTDVIYSFIFISVTSLQLQLTYMYDCQSASNLNPRRKDKTGHHNVRYQNMNIDTIPALYYDGDDFVCG